MDVILDSLDQTLLDPIYSWIKHMATDLACVVESPIGPWGALRRQNSYTAGLRNEICVAIGSENIWDRQSIARQYLSLFVFAMCGSLEDSSLWPGKFSADIHLGYRVHCFFSSLVVSAIIAILNQR
jgi:hypothetical protein